MVTALGSIPIIVNSNEIEPGQYSSIISATAPGYGSALMNVNLTVNNATLPPTLNPIGDKTLQPGEILHFEADATAGFGQTATFSLVNAPSGAVIDAATGVFNWVAPAETGTYPLTIRVSYVNLPNLYDEETIAVTVKLTDPADVPVIRINAGGKDFTTADSRVFQADRFSSGARTSSVEHVDILNTPDDELYRTTRSEELFHYEIPVKTGVYKVTLHFAEIYWGVSPNRPAINIRRKFNVDAEGQRKLDDYSILQNAGAPLTAVTETFEVDVKDGFLSLRFVKNADRASLSAIEAELIKPLTELSLAPVADAYVRYGSSSQTNYGLEQTIDIKATTKAELARTAYIKFSLAKLQSINQATIRIYGRNHEGSNTVQAGLTGIDNDNRTETGIIASNAPTGTPVFLGKFNSLRKARFYEIDITEFVKSQLAQDKTLTLILADLFTTNKRVMFNSRENAVNPPELIVTTTEPAISSEE